MTYRKTRQDNTSIYHNHKVQLIYRTMSMHDTILNAKTIVEHHKGSNTININQEQFQISYTTIYKELSTEFSNVH